MYWQDKLIASLIIISLFKISKKFNLSDFLYFLKRERALRGGSVEKTDLCVSKREKEK